MDMEKIFILCNADYLQFEFPKRKWYKIRQYNRIAVMRLAFADKDIVDTDIGIEIYENYEGEPIFRVAEEFRVQLYESLLWQYVKIHENAEHLIVMDNGEDLSEVLYLLAENRNYLSIITENPGWYEDAEAHMEENYGLMPMFFSSCKDLMRYLKQMPEQKKVFFISGNPDLEKEKDFGTQKRDKYVTSVICGLARDSVWMDLSDNGIQRDLIFKKRLKITYLSVPIFLDNIVKNRYNAVVNEGITIQVKNDKKQVWRRKGNEDGRKEKYPDL